VSRTRVLEHALLASGFPYDQRRHAAAYLAYWQPALERAQGVRRAGSAALDLCYLACGRLDGFWEWKLKPWDTAAGRLIVEEAGGRVTDARGDLHRLVGDETVASNGLLHDAILQMLAAAPARVPTSGALP
jgi:myo-inositol-1(or 4)-monophosphatase